MPSTDQSNPFVARGEYSAQAVELMRAMSQLRQQSGVTVSSPAQVLNVVKDLGYCFEDADLSDDKQVELFALAMQQYQNANEITHPTCDDVLNVLEGIGVYRPIGETPTVIPGLPIDRRRRSEDGRADRQERRSSLEPSAQEQLDLTDEENRFLDALRDLRNATGREFASSEELLSIVWSLGYRPVSEQGFPVEWLDDNARVEKQTEFTSAVERRVADADEQEFLTCRGVLEIVDQIGFRLP